MTSPLVALPLAFEERDSFKHAARFTSLGLTAYGKTKHEAFLNLSRMLAKFCATHNELGTLEKVLGNALATPAATEESGQTERVVIYSAAVLPDGQGLWGVNDAVYRATSEQPESVRRASYPDLEGVQRVYEQPEEGD